MIEIISALGFESMKQFAVISICAVGLSSLFVLAGREARPLRLR